MAEPTRIDDLARPRLTEAQRQALADAERRPVELTVDAVLAGAVARTGLDDFGPSDFRRRLALWLEEVDRDPERTAHGRAAIAEICTSYAANRLRIHDLLDRHPEIRDEEVRAPIVIAGLPRSGTTHLLELIGADPRLRALPLWESYQPVPTPGEGPGRDGVDPRYARAAARWQEMQRLLPRMAAMHPMTPDHLHEDLELQVPDFSSYSLEWHCRCPGWRDHYLSHDQTPHYEYLRTVLQVLQWLRPGERWVLKCPQHLEQLGPLLATFPDATVVVTHRDPVAVVQSAATMLAYTARMGYRRTRPEWYLEYWTDRVGRLLDASQRDRHLLQPGRSHDVVFRDLVADPRTTVEAIYEAAGLPVTDEVRARLDRRAGGRHRAGGSAPAPVAYDLRADFDADPADVRRRFEAYLEAHPVELEVT